ncbi:MBL fold metallo-hydrolase [Candidatus Peregrinibacteria bacterium]|nr:MBL fold metallo-hydrolase [Candidatus Peregrinibacteria bacterium]
MKKLLGIFFAAAVVLFFLLWKILGGITDHALHVYVLNIGQGDSILVRLDTGENILIDGGPDGTVLRELAKVLPLYERKIDVMILTHPHADHMNGLLEVFQHYQVSNVIITGVFYKSSAYEEFMDQIARKKISIFFAHSDTDYRLGTVALDMVYPLKLAQGDRYENLNNSSISFRLLSRDGTIYFSGDLEKEGEEELLRSGQNLHAGVLKAGHHGSRTSSSEALLEAIRPQIAVISCGINNTFKHPHPETLQHFAERGIEFFRTDMDGRVDITAEAGQFFIETENQKRPP